jgi:transposase InsO family protein
MLGPEQEGRRMPWQEQHTMDLRQEFIALAQQEGVNRRELCRRFGISPKTGYKWLARAAAGGGRGSGDIAALETALRDRSRRPHHAPGQSSPAVEAAVVGTRLRFPAWGGRKLRAWLGRHGVEQGFWDPAIPLPSASTITAILRRHHLLEPADSLARRRVQRFEHAAPNDLWQMDFKGHLPLGCGRVHPLCVVDDYSRFALGIYACADERWSTLPPLLTDILRSYGLPWAMLTDNGAPWAAPGHRRAYTRVELWLLRLDIELWHGRPHHPQTQGKVERFNGTLGAEILRPWQYPDLASCQRAFDDWRQIYNLQRPHEALDDGVPADRYQLSPRPFPAQLPPLLYPERSQLRRVNGSGQIVYRNHYHFIGEALIGERVGLLETQQDGLLGVYWGHHEVSTIDVRYPLDDR